MRPCQHPWRRLWLALAASGGCPLRLSPPALRHSTSSISGRSMWANGSGVFQHHHPAGSPAASRAHRHLARQRSAPRLPPRQRRSLTPSLGDPRQWSQSLLLTTWQQRCSVSWRAAWRATRGELRSRGSGPQATAALSGSASLWRTTAEVPDSACAGHRLVRAVRGTRQYRCMASAVL